MKVNILQFLTMPYILISNVPAVRACLISYCLDSANSGTLFTPMRIMEAHSMDSHLIKLILIPSFSETYTFILIHLFSYLFIGDGNKKVHCKKKDDPPLEGRPIYFIAGAQILFQLPCSVPWTLPPSRHGPADRWGTICNQGSLSAAEPFSARLRTDLKVATINIQTSYNPASSIGKEKSFCNVK